MTKMILVSAGVFVGFIYTATIIVHAAWKQDVLSLTVITAGLGWAAFTLGLLWG